MNKSVLMQTLVIGLALSLPGAIAFAADTTAGSAKPTAADASFIKEAAQGGMMEVELGKTAQEKASDEKVKEFGKRMEQDHTKANDELKKIASDKGIQLPSGLDKQHEAKIDKLTKLSGANFDRQYMLAMVSDHRQDIKEFQNEANKGKDADVKKFASETLPTLKEHLELAQSTAKDVKSSGKMSKSTH